MKKKKLQGILQRAKAKAHKRLASSSGSTSLAIGKFHSKLKQKECKVAVKESSNEAGDSTEGGLSEYQDASVQGATSAIYARFNSARWVMRMIKELSIHSEEEGGRVSVLDVGSLRNEFINLPTYHKLDVTAIDINPRHTSG